MSVITVVLFQMVSSYVTSPFFCYIVVGGLNNTELYDLTQMTGTASDPTRGGVKWNCPRSDDAFQYESLIPPVSITAPYLSRIKTWGYKLTFYETYTHPPAPMSGSYNGDFPVVHHWILEKESNLVVLPEPPITTTTVRPTTTTTKTTTALTTTERIPTTDTTTPVNTTKQTTITVTTTTEGSYNTTLHVGDTSTSTETELITTTQNHSNAMYAYSSIILTLLALIISN